MSAKKKMSWGVWRVACLAASLLCTGLAQDAMVLAASAITAPQGVSQDRKRVEWREDFETKDPVKFWVAQSKYEVHFKGLTEGMVVSGKKAFKLDVTFKEGGYYYWHIPVRFPAEGMLKFSGRILLGKETTGTAGLGVNISFPPSQQSGCSSFQDFRTTNGKWRTVEGDVVASAEKLANGAASKNIAFVTGADVGRVLDRIGILLHGSAGQRVVLYLDDFRLDGEIPAEQAYRRTIDTRWAAVQDQIKEHLAAHRKSAVETKKKVQVLGEVSGLLKPIAVAIKEKLTGLETMLAIAGKRGYLNRNEHADLADGFRTLAATAGTLKDLTATGTVFQNFIPTVLDNPITRTPILPSDKLLPGKLAGTEIHMTAAKGEYESASVVIQALKDIEGLLLEVSDLRQDGGEAVIHSTEIDIRAVKCWYQAGTAWTGIDQNKTVRKLTPELLLKNDGLVRVDYAKEKNYLRLSFPDGIREVWTSNPDEDSKDYKILRPEEFPVRDSRQLRPLDLKASVNKQYWITVRVPEDAVNGSYTATLKIRGNNAVLGTISLRLRVLPFVLPLPKTYYDLSKNFTSSIYYRGVLGGSKRKGAGFFFPDGSISSEYKSETQLRAELQDMLAHNILNPTSYQGLENLGTYLRIRNELGMKGLPLFSLGVSTGSPKDTAGLRALQESVKELRAVVFNYGIEEVYVYGIDEAQGEALLAQRPAWKAVHKAGGKLFVAGYEGHFEKVGDLLDTLVEAGMPTLDEARKWHSAGHQVFSYANPQTGPENPEAFRRNFGLLLWKAEYDGAMTYAYQHSLGNIYNDFDNASYRDLVFSYPTVDGVIPTLAIEGFREGIDDIRYGTLLKTWIAKRKAEVGPKAELAASAEKYLETLEHDRDIGFIRLKMIDMILNLMQD